MTTIIACYRPHAGFGKTCNKIFCSKSPNITKKNLSKKHAPEKYYSKEQSIKHVLSNKSDFKPNIHLNMIVSSLKTKLWILGILRVCTFHKNIITIDRKAGYMKKNLSYFQTQK